MIRLYDTNKGVIATDEQNKSLRRHGHILITYVPHNDVFRPAYTREPVACDNLVEEILEGTKPKYDLQRLMTECATIRRMTTITEETYNKTIINYEHPGCIGMIARALRVRKSFDEILRENFPGTKF
jgi:hypothetical protein